MILQKSKMAVFLLVAALCVFSLGTAVALGQSTIGGRIKDFVAPSSDQEGKKSVLKGADARHIGNRVYHITKPVVTVRQPDDTLEMLIEAAECLFNENSRTAYSTNVLSVKTGDEKFSLTGKGWRWDPAVSHLVISNDVVALVKKSAVMTNSLENSSSTGTNQPIRITSRMFDHEEQTARFMEQVKVVDEQGTVTCDLLQLFFEKKGGPRIIEAIQNVVIQQGEMEARGGKAIYQIAQNKLTLTNKPTWQFGTRSGSSDLLVMDRTNQTIQALGSVYMKMPRTSFAQTNQLASVAQANNSGTNEDVEIFADSFLFQQGRSTNDPGIAYYTGNVRVAQPQGELLCKQLTVYFSPGDNKLYRAVAEKDVVVARTDGKVRGERAVYELADEKITMTGNPRWQFGERSGTCRILTFYTKSEELYALDQVAMSMPAGNGSAAINFSQRHRKEIKSEGDTGLPGTNAPVVITADLFSHKGDLSVFSGKVLVKDSRGELSSDLLTIVTGASNQVQKITADQNVIIRQPDMVATGKSAVYTATNGIVELTGSPVITSQDKRVKADIFWINREKSTFSFRGNYKMEAATVEQGTNRPMALFPLKPEAAQGGTKR